MISPLPPPPSLPLPETISLATSTFHSLKSSFRDILSYDSNILLAAIISLLLVILFVLLLHIYAKWFLVHARHRSRTSVSVPQVLGIGTRFHHFHSFNTITTESPTKGLDSSVISKIPLFLYKKQEQGSMECIICLSGFEEEELGRRLPKCCHVFHVPCIDMWLHSHSTCPICRAPVLLLSSEPETQILDSNNSVSSSNQLDPTILNHNSDPVHEERFSSTQDSILLEVIVDDNVPNSENDITTMKDSEKKTTIKNSRSSERKVHPSSSVNDTFLH